MSTKAELVATQMAASLNVNKIWGSLVCNVKDKQFAGGAKGGGVLDDTAAIQAALDYVSAAGGGVVIFPLDTYRTTYTLLYGSNTRLDFNGSTLYYDTTQTDGTAIVSKSYLGTVLTENVVVENLNLRTNTGQGNGIGTPKAKNVLIRNCRTSQLHWHLVDIAGGENITVEKCSVENTGDAGIQIDNLSQVGGLFVENYDHTLTSALVDFTASKNITIRNNTVKNCLVGIHLHRNGGKDIRIEGNEVVDCATGILGDASTTWSNIIIFANIIYKTASNADGDGILLRGIYDNVLIHNNLVVNHNRGISVKQNDSLPSSATKGIVISDNTIRDVKTRGIILDWASGVISGNTVTNCGYNLDTSTFNSTNTKVGDTAVGINIYSSQDVICRGNVLRDIKGIGVFLYKTLKNIKVSENIFENFANGVCAYDGTPAYVDVINNKFEASDYAYWGIYFATGSKVVIQNNSFLNMKYNGIATDNITEEWIKGNIVKGLVGSNSGLSIFTCTDVVLKDNDVEGFTNNTSISSTSSNVRGEGIAPISIQNTATTVVLEYDGTAAPTTQTWGVGSKVRNTAPAASGFIGWVCVTAGTPGTWKGYGSIAP